MPQWWESFGRGWSGLSHQAQGSEAGHHCGDGGGLRGEGHPQLSHNLAVVKSGFLVQV
jgi:hypothetical protein